MSYLKDEWFKDIADTSLEMRGDLYYQRLASNAMFVGGFWREVVVYISTVVYSKERKKITLDSGGYYTRSTMKWINFGLRQHGFKLVQRGGVWIILDRNDKQVRLFDEDIISFKI